jgi:hypothetical protein
MAIKKGGRIMKNLLLVLLILAILIILISEFA